MIDSLHAWAGGLPGADRGEYEALNLSIRACLKLAADLEAPVLVVAERNRKSGKSGGQDASAGSRKFEYSAESVLALQRVDETDDEDDTRTPAGKPRQAPEGCRAMQLIAQKNRHGKEGERIDLDYDPQIMRFTDPNESRKAGNGKDWY